MLSRLRDIILYDEKLCENSPTTLNKFDQQPQATQGRSGSHDLITTWPTNNAVIPIFSHLFYFLKAIRGGTLCLTLISYQRSETCSWSCRSWSSTNWTCSTTTTASHRASQSNQLTKNNAPAFRWRNSTLAAILASISGGNRFWWRFG